MDCDREDTENKTVTCPVGAGERVKQVTRHIFDNRPWQDHDRWQAKDPNETWDWS
jgi:hypothetical protein